jgi:hypothetical protein
VTALAAIEAESDRMARASAWSLALDPTVVTGIALLSIAGILVRYAVFAVSTGETGVQAYFDALCVWDCGWYKTIVETGYDYVPGMRLRPGAANWPFFPLYPTTVAFVRSLTHLPATTVGFFLSSLYIGAAALVIRPLYGTRVRAFWLFAILLLVGPFSFLFNTMYAESLFILLTALVLLMLQQGRYLAAGVFGALLSATRLTGVLIVFGILVQALADHLSAGRRVRDFPARVLGDPKLVLALVVAPLGLFCYMLYLYRRVGDAFAFVHIERAWNRAIGNPAEALWNALTVPWPLNADGMIILSWGLAGLVGLLLCAVLVVQRRFAAATFCALSIIVSLAGGVGSMVRFVAGLFPVGMALAQLLAHCRIVWAITAIGAVVADVVLMTGWLKSSLFVM